MEHTREIVPCYSCRREYGADWIAPFHVLIDEKPRSIHVCLECIRTVRVPAVSVDESAAWIAELTLVAAGELPAGATEGERRLQELVQAELADANGRSDFLEVLHGWMSGSAAACAEYDDSIVKLEALLGHCVQKRATVEDGSAAARSCEAMLNGVEAQLMALLSEDPTPAGDPPPRR